MTLSASESTFFASSAEFRFKKNAYGSYTYDRSNRTDNSWCFRHTKRSVHHVVRAANPLLSARSPRTPRPTAIKNARSSVKPPTSNILESMADSPTKAGSATSAMNGMTETTAKVSSRPRANSANVMSLRERRSSGVRISHRRLQAPRIDPSASSSDTGRRLESASSCLTGMRP